MFATASRMHALVESLSLPRRMRKVVVNLVIFIVIVVVVTAMTSGVKANSIDRPLVASKRGLPLSLRSMLYKRAVVFVDRFVVVIQKLWQLVYSRTSLPTMIIGRAELGTLIALIALFASRHGASKDTTWRLQSREWRL